MHHYVKSMSVFLIFATMILLEYWLPYYKNKPLFESRKFSNLFMAFLNFFVGRFFGVVLIFQAMKLKIGLFHHIEISTSMKFAFTLILMDLALYFQHILSHRIPLFWRFHKVHHSDLFLDATSGVRFHFGEIFISYGYKAVIGILIGAAWTDILMFESILAMASVFNHANISMHEEVNKFLKLFIVTPQMHRIHHSTLGHETDSNFGFFVSIWDRLFKTYREKADLGSSLTFGEPKKSLEKDLSLKEMITYPFT